MQHFIYITTNLVNGKYYIGKKSTRREDLQPAYLGSGLKLQNAIKKYGRESFKRDIICFASCETSLSELEAKLVTLETVQDPLCYNLALGGQGGDRGPEANAKISAKAKGRKMPREAVERTAAAKRGVPRSLESRLKQSASFKGSKKSTAHKEKMQATQRGRVSINNGTQEKKIKPEDLVSFLDSGWVIGRLEHNIRAAIDGKKYRS
jgi:group I intron endonuclease